MMIPFILIVLGSIFQGVAMFRSGMMYDYGIGYWGPMARDGVWHEALVAQLTKHIPPFNPGLAGVPLTNYHYYYDLVIALVSRLGVPPSLLIYRIFPIIFSALLGIGTYKLSNLLFKDKITSYLAVFFAFFASSFGWIVSLIKGQQLGGESAFWANQPVSFNLNPPYAISLIIIIFVVLLIDNYLKKRSLLKAIAIVLLSGTLIGFKVYAGIVLLGGLFILTVKRYIFDKDKKLIPLLILSSLISFAIFWTEDRSATGLLEFQPFWLINTMVDAGDRVGIPNFTARRFAYIGGGKWIQFIAIEIVSFIIFFAGNLGTRIFGMIGISKKDLRSDFPIFILGMMAISVIPPLLFIQKGNSWNIIQFFYYFMYFAGLFAASAVRKLPVAIAILVLIITPISSITTFRSWLYPNPPAYLSTNEYQGLKFLSTQNPGIVLKHPFNSAVKSSFNDPFPIVVYADNAYISAYSGMQVFIEDAEQQIVLNSDYETRLKEASRFFAEKDLTWSKKFLKENHIAYIYLPKIYLLPMAEDEYPMVKIFENNEVNIYKVVE